MKKLFLVDAYALIFKYYYAFMGRPMRNRAGMNTSVVFGFTKFLRDIQKREYPDLLGVAFDPKGGSFRREIFPEYKANRAETPEDILLSVPYVKRIVEAMCIPVLEVPGYEADDVIGTLAYKGVEAGYDVFMVTPDKDYGQLVCDNCKIYKQKGNDGIEIVGREAIREKYGIENPQLVRDILALWGDASDNIPGVPGIGEKTACKLVQEWGTVENILQNADRIKGRQGEKIAEWGDKLLLAKRLTTICLDVPIDFREEDLTVCAPRIDELKALFAELDFRIFLNFPFKPHLHHLDDADLDCFRAGFLQILQLGSGQGREFSRFVLSTRPHGFLIPFVDRHISRSHRITNFCRRVIFDGSKFFHFSSGNTKEVSCCF